MAYKLDLLDKNGEPLCVVETEKLNSMRGVDLSLLVLKGLRAPFMDFSKSHITASVLDAAELESCDFRGATLTNLSFVGASLRYADFGGATLTGINFSGADLTGVNLVGARVENCEFPDATVDFTVLDPDRAVLPYSLPEQGNE